MTTASKGASRRRTRRRDLPAQAKAHDESSATERKRQKIGQAVITPSEPQGGGKSGRFSVGKGNKKSRATRRRRVRLDQVEGGRFPLGGERRERPRSQRFRDRGRRFRDGAIQGG